MEKALPPSFLTLRQNSRRPAAIRNAKEVDSRFIKLSLIAFGFPGRHPQRVAQRAYQQGMTRLRQRYCPKLEVTKEQSGGRFWRQHVFHGKRIRL
jgi:hypothetical protein